jgi:hypothetical protein
VPKDPSAASGRLGPSSGEQRTSGLPWCPGGRHIPGDQDDAAPYQGVPEKDQVNTDRRARLFRPAGAPRPTKFTCPSPSPMTSDGPSTSPSNGDTSRQSRSAASRTATPARSSCTGKYIKSGYVITSRLVLLGVGMGSIRCRTRIVLRCVATATVIAGARCYFPICFPGGAKSEAE